LHALIVRPNAPWLFLATAVAGAGLFGFAIGALMLEPSAALGDRLPELTCLQVAFTPARFSEVFLSFDAGARAAIPRLLAPGDMVFAWGYGLLLAGLTGLLTLRLTGGWQRAGVWVMWAPLVAATLDCVEDVFLYVMADGLLTDPGWAMPGALPLLAGIAASVKYFALSVVTPAFGLAGIVRAVADDRSLVALLLYALLGLFLVSMVLRPAQQIPPCF
jgi:hypothetical protein